MVDHGGRIAGRGAAVNRRGGLARYRNPVPARRSEMASIQAKTRRKPGPPPQPPELRETRKVGLTEATFAKVPALRGSAWHPTKRRPGTRRGRKMPTRFRLCPNGKQSRLQAVSQPDDVALRAAELHQVDRTPEMTVFVRVALLPQLRGPLPPALHHLELEQVDAPADAYRHVGAPPAAAVLRDRLDAVHQEAAGRSRSGPRILRRDCSCATGAEWRRRCRGTGSRGARSRSPPAVHAVAGLPSSCGPRPGAVPPAELRPGSGAPPGSGSPACSASRPPPRPRWSGSRSGTEAPRSTSKVESRASLPVMLSRSGVGRPRRASVSTRKVGVPLWNQ